MIAFLSNSASFDVVFSISPVDLNASKQSKNLQTPRCMSVLTSKFRGKYLHKINKFYRNYGMFFARSEGTILLSSISMNLRARSNNFYNVI